MCGGDSRSYISDFLSFKTYKTGQQTIIKRFVYYPIPYRNSKRILNAIRTEKAVRSKTDGFFTEFKPYIKAQNWPQTKMAITLYFDRIFHLFIEAKQKSSIVNSDGKFRLEYCLYIDWPNRLKYWPKSRSINKTAKTLTGILYAKLTERICRIYMIFMYCFC